MTRASVIRRPRLGLMVRVTGRVVRPVALVGTGRVLRSEPAHHPISLPIRFTKPSSWPLALDLHRRKLKCASPGEVVGAPQARRGRPGGAITLFILVTMSH